MAILIFWPGLVTHWLDKEPQVNLDEVTIDMQIEDMGADAPVMDLNDVPLDVPAE